MLYCNQPNWNAVSHSLCKLHYISISCRLTKHGVSVCDTMFRYIWEAFAQSNVMKHVKSVSCAFCSRLCWHILAQVYLPTKTLICQIYSGYMLVGNFNAATLLQHNRGSNTGVKFCFSYSCFVCSSCLGWYHMSLDWSMKQGWCIVTMLYCYDDAFIC